MTLTDILGPHPVKALPARDESRPNLVDISDHRERAPRLFGTNAIGIGNRHGAECSIVRAPVPLPDPPCDVEEEGAA